MPEFKHYLDYELDWHRYRDFYTKLGFPRKMTDSDKEVAKAGRLYRDSKDGLFYSLSFPRFVLRARKDKEFSEKWVNSSQN